ncbi:hypothetical protein ACQKPZ_21920, partial [Pseudomonas sp. NPDC089547]
LRSSPGNSCGEAEILGLLRSPFATQGRSYRGWISLPGQIQNLPIPLSPAFAQTPQNLRTVFLAWPHLFDEALP